MARRFPAPRTSRPAARGFRNDLRNLAPDLRRQTGEALRSATRQIISDLQEASPNYSGEFKRRWYSQVEGRGNKVFAATGVPRFTDEQLKRGAPTILIGNTSPYAQEAMDLIPGRFERPAEPPKGEIVAQGRRVDGIRGHVREGDGNAISTAEADWYSTYMEGGGFGQAFKQGARSGFVRPVIDPSGK